MNTKKAPGLAVIKTLYHILIIVISICYIPNEALSQQINCPGPQVPFYWCTTDKRSEVNFFAKDTSHLLYTWSFGDKDSGISTGHTTSYLYSANNGMYEVTLTVTDKDNCIGTFTANVGIGFLDNSLSPHLCPHEDIFIGIKNNKSLTTINIYPNPFSNKTLIEYELLRSQQVRVSVWDATGKEVAVLSNGMKAVGVQQVSLDANEHKLQPGLYMIRIETEGTVATSQVLRLE